MTSDPEVAALVEALDEAASTFDALYHYTFDHGLPPGRLAEIVRKECTAASLRVRRALQEQNHDRNG